METIQLISVLLNALILILISVIGFLFRSSMNQGGRLVSANSRLSALEKLFDEYKSVMKETIERLQETIDNLTDLVEKWREEFISLKAKVDYIEKEVEKLRRQRKE